MIRHGREHDPRMAQDHDDYTGNPHISPATWKECEAAFKQSWRELVGAVVLSSIVLGLAVAAFWWQK